MDHTPGFLKLVNQAKDAIHEISIDAARSKIAGSPATVLIDVREDHEWTAGHAVEARHLGKGILERDLEQTFPAKDTELLMYCGGGFRSALSCEAAQEMGYTRVFSISGGYKAMLAAGWPTTSGV